MFIHPAWHTVGTWCAMAISSTNTTICYLQQSTLICWCCSNVNVLGLQTKNAKITIYHPSSICGCNHYGCNCITANVWVCMDLPIWILLFAHNKYQPELWIHSTRKKQRNVKNNDKTKHDKTRQLNNTIQGICNKQFSVRFFPRISFQKYRQKNRMPSSRGSKRAIT